MCREPMEHTLPGEPWYTASRRSAGSPGRLATVRCTREIGRARPISTLAEKREQRALTGARRARITLPKATDLSVEIRPLNLKPKLRSRRSS